MFKPTYPLLATVVGAIVLSYAQGASADRSEPCTFGTLNRFTPTRGELLTKQFELRAAEAPETLDDVVCDVGLSKDSCVERIEKNWDDHKGEVSFAPYIAIKEGVRSSYKKDGQHVVRDFESLEACAQYLIDARDITTRATCRNWPERWGVRVLENPNNKRTSTTLLSATMRTLWAAPGQGSQDASTDQVKALREELKVSGFRLSTVEPAGTTEHFWLEIACDADWLGASGTPT